MYVNVLGSVVAAFVTFMLGAPWYSPAMFLNTWARERGLDISKPRTRSRSSKAADDAKHMPYVFVVAYVCALMGALTLSYQLGENPGVERGVTLGVMVGVGYISTCFGINYSFASFGWRVWAIDAAYHVVQYALFGLILGLWP